MAEAGSRCYIRFIVNVPEPVQPVVPVSVQVPEIALPATTPLSTSVLPADPWDFIVIPKVPLVWPLKFPLKPNEPDSVSPDAKHAEFVVKLKLLMLNDPPLSPADNVVPKANAV
jgi:hypothetical protein